MEKPLGGAISGGKAREVIVVGIDNLSFRDYYLDTPYQYDGIPGELQEYADFIRLELIPEINERSRTLAGPENSAIMGFEANAAKALYLAWDFPNTFGKDGLIKLGGQPGLTKVIAFDPPRKVKISLNAIVSDFAKSRDLRNILAGKLSGPFAIEEDLRLLFKPDESSGLETYRSRLGGMLSFLFPTAEEVENTAFNSANPYWLTFYGLRPVDWDLDRDQDGWSILEKYPFGTDPINGASFPEFSLRMNDRRFHAGFQNKSRCEISIAGKPGPRAVGLARRITPRNG